MMTYTLNQLIYIMNDGKNILQILNRSKSKISDHICILNPRELQYFLDLIKIFKDDPYKNVNTCDIFDKLHIINCSIDNNLATRLVDTVVEENYDIEKILSKIYVTKSIVNVMNVVNFEINYDKVFTEALTYNSDNLAILKYIISNNCVDYNNFNYSEIEFDTACILDVLLTHGFDISKFPINSLNIDQMLHDISKQNIKYFSNIKMSLSQYISIMVSLSDDRLKEFSRSYNIDNIICSEPNNKVTKKVIDRVQILFDSGIDLRSILNVIMSALYDCECDCLGNE